MKVEIRFYDALSLLQFTLFRHKAIYSISKAKQLRNAG